MLVMRLIGLLVLLSASGLLAAEGLPDWWPDGVPVHPGAAIERVDHALERGLPDVKFDFRNNAIDTTAVVDYYVEELNASGWKVGKLNIVDEMSRGFTADHKAQNRRVIVTAFEPDSVFNRNPHVRLKITVYREIP